MSRAVVDLPQPDSPTIPKVLPLGTEKLTPSTAWTDLGLSCSRLSTPHRKIFFQVANDQQRLGRATSILN